MVTINDNVFVDMFGIPVVFRLKNGETIETSGIFDKNIYNAQMGQYEPDAEQITLHCLENDVKNVKFRDIAVINTVEYGVIHNKPDGTGMSVLILG